MRGLNEFFLLVFFSPIIQKCHVLSILQAAPREETTGRM